MSFLKAHSVGRELVDARSCFLVSGILGEGRAHEAPVQSRGKCENREWSLHRRLDLDGPAKIYTD
jgi:hypothetical protein